MKQFLMIIMCCLVLTGCYQSDPEPSEIIQTEAAAAPKEKETTPPTETDPFPSESTMPETTPMSEPTVPPAQTEPLTFTFKVYRGNDNADGFESAEMIVETLSESIIMEKLIEVGILSADTALNSFEAAENVLYLDFNTAFADQVCAMGTAGEYMIMGSVVNTFLNAYAAESIIITVEGGILESGHVIYDFPLKFFE